VALKYIFEARKNLKERFHCYRNKWHLKCLLKASVVSGYFSSPCMWLTETFLFQAKWCFPLSVVWGLQDWSGRFISCQYEVCWTFRVCFVSFHSIGWSVSFQTVSQSVSQLLSQSISQSICLLVFSLRVAVSWPESTNFRYWHFNVFCCYSCPSFRSLSGCSLFVRVEVMLRGATFHVLFTDASQLPPPFRIDNLSEVCSEKESADTIRAILYVCLWFCPELCN